jgi:microcystin degradation protein MlrC
MRIAVGQLFQESNTFAPIPTTLATFEAVFFRRGEELRTGFGDSRVEVPAFFDVLEREGVEAVPLLAASALAGGAVTREAFESIMQELESRLTAAGPLDGVLLALHGAMCIEDEPDAESEIVRRVAAMLPRGTPIGVSLDLHGHITPKMLQPNVFYVGYREYPHIDMYETGERVANTLLDTLRGKVRPRMAVTKLPMIVSPTQARTVDEPLRSILPVARTMEADGEILHASVFPVQPWLDIPDLGFAVLVCADGDAAAAQRAADRIATLAWGRRAEFDPALVTLEDAIATGLTSEGTTVVADSGDAPSGGAAADNVAVLKALLAAGADRAPRPSYLTLCDAESARLCANAGIGAEVTFDVGHKVSRKDGKPLRITARVTTLSDGSFVMLGAGMRGARMEQGLTAVITIGQIHLVLRSLPAIEWDTGIYTAFGLRLEAAALVFVKSPSHFRVAFEPHARRVLNGDTPGPTCPNMRRLVFHHVTRPLYPLDPVESMRRT